MRLIKPTCLKTFERDSPMVEALFDTQLRSAGYTVMAGQMIHHQCNRDADHKGVCTCDCGVGNWPLDAYTPSDGEAQRTDNDERASVEAGH